MSGVECVGGKCPLCGHGLLQKYESSYSGYMFDACPSCGYLNSNTEDLNRLEGKSDTDDDKETLKKNIIEDWKTILNHCRCNNRVELIKCSKIRDNYTTEESEFYPTILELRGDDLKNIKEAVEELKRDNLI